MSKFATFWMGKLSPYEHASLLSFVDFGHEVTLFSYETIPGVPPQIIQRNANDIVDRSYVDRFITDGKRNIAAFSDYFRYQMFKKENICWIDADVFMLKSFEVPKSENFLVEEGRNKVCNALLNINPNSKELDEIIRKCEAMLDRDLPWGALQSANGKAFASGTPGFKMKSHLEYMPVECDDFYKYLLPEHCEEVETLTKEAKSIHLYNNILDKIGYHKWALPPNGSYLNKILRESSVADKFFDTYPVETVRVLTDGWKLRFSGEAIGFGTVIKQFIPSAIRTARRRLRT
jgi:hypothetical protein